MSPSTCPHGLQRDECQICQVLEPTAVPAGRAGRRPDRGRAGLGGNLAVVAIVAVVGFVVLGWVAAAFFAVIRIVELLAVAAIAGWVGWKLRRRGLELQAALPEPRRGAAGRADKRSSEGAEIAGGAFDLALGFGLVGLLLAIPGVIIWLLCRLRRFTDSLVDGQPR